MAVELKENIEKLGELLMLPWLMNADMSVLKIAIEGLISQMTKYHTFLTGMKKRTDTNQNKVEPVRGFNDNWTLRTIEPNALFKAEYNALNQALCEVEEYQMIDLINFEPNNKNDR